MCDEKPQNSHAIAYCYSKFPFHIAAKIENPEKTSKKVVENSYQLPNFTAVRGNLPVLISFYMYVIFLNKFISISIAA